MNINNKKINNDEEYIEVDFTPNVDYIETVVLDLKKNNIIDVCTLQEYVRLFINLMNSLKNQKKREVKSFSDTSIVKKTKKIGKLLNFRDELMYFVSNNNSQNENREKFSSWNVIKKRLLKNEIKLNDNKLTLNKARNNKEVFKSHSAILIPPNDVLRKERFMKCWPSDYDKLLLYVKNEMNILFEINKDYIEVLRLMKILKSKKELYKKNANSYKLLIPVSIKNEYFGTAYKKLQLFFIYEKLGLPQNTNDNIKNFIKYDESVEYVKFHLLKLELLFHQYEIRLIRLFIKLNVMHKELLEIKIKKNTN
ncbi:Hypothetical protein SRAE_2000106900 [Strongyloides ratti]|uniref:Uncharacterized protein n=1 Tax=Strongyloides ratti TaxID=34506 RepID=A0A090LFX2_STRRB|nr:Hypothetical protein SRAE_2000106900 [Strongyloides ratti]CEF66400.1 Hypothetical protein SRAE_2000106900 [Strongyloides ratti]